MLAGFITFPVLTRVFSVEDYGVMNLVAVTVTMTVAVGKLGVQHSIVRYQSEIKAGKSRFTLNQHYSTTVVGMVATAFAIAALMAIGIRLIPSRLLPDRRLVGLLALGSTIVAADVIESAFVNFIRADQETARLMRYQVAKKYLGLGAILFAVLIVTPTLYSFYTANAVAEWVGVLALVLLVFRNKERPRPRLSEFSRPLYGEMLLFGIPMMIGYELSYISLAVGDRYVIEGMIGEAPLGLYGAACNLCQYVAAAIVTSMGQAVVPLYMNIWDREGPAEASAFITNSLRTYALFAAPVIAGLAAVGPELLRSLAADKYSGGAPVIPWVIAGMVIDGANTMLGAGLFVNRRTRIVMGIVLSCAVGNILLNVALVPRMGILGSAVATLVSYLATSCLMATIGRKFLPIRIPWRTIVIAASAGLAMYACIARLWPGHHWQTVGLRALLGAPIYVAAVAVLDLEARNLLRQAAGRLWSGKKGQAV